MQGDDHFSALPGKDFGSCREKKGERTVVYLFGELVVLQQGAHFTARYAAQDVLHLGSLLAQPKVKIPEPEDLVESRRDVSCNRRKGVFFFYSELESALRTETAQNQGVSHGVER